MLNYMDFEDWPEQSLEDMMEAADNEYWARPENVKLCLEAEELARLAEEALDG